MGSWKACTSSVVNFKTAQYWLASYVSIPFSASSQHRVARGTAGFPSVMGNFGLEVDDLFLELKLFLFQLCDIEAI